MENNDPVGGVAVPTEPTAPLKLHDNPARTGADRPIDPVEVSAGAPAPVTLADVVAAPWPMTAMVDANEWHGIQYRCAADARLTMIERTPRRWRGVPWGASDAANVPMGRRFQVGGVEYERLADAVAALPPSHERGR